MNLKNIPKEIKAAILYRAIEVLKTQTNISGMCGAIKYVIENQFPELDAKINSKLSVNISTQEILEEIYPLFNKNVYRQFCIGNFDFTPQGYCWWDKPLFVDFINNKSYDFDKPERQRRIAFLTYILKTYETARYI